MREEWVSSVTLSSCSHVLSTCVLPEVSMPSMDLASAGSLLVRRPVTLKEAGSFCSMHTVSIKFIVALASVAITSTYPAPIGCFRCRSIRHRLPSLHQLQQLPLAAQSQSQARYPAG